MFLRKFRIVIIERILESYEYFLFTRHLEKFYKNTFNKNLRCAIDVGANKGQSIDNFLKLNKNCNIYSFEPNSYLFKKLERKYISKKNVKIFQCGISDFTGQKLFNENVFDPTSTFEELNIESRYLRTKAKILGVKPECIIKNKYFVNVTTLAGFISENIFEPIDIVKIDTEGHEYQCISGLFDGQINTNIKFIQLEIHNDDMYIHKKSVTDVYNILEKNGFILYKRIKHGFGDFDELIFKNKNYNESF